MTFYLWTKLVHVVSATVLFGTGLGTAYFMLSAMRSRNLEAIRVTSTKVVTADWIFTTPAIVIQPLSGAVLMIQSGIAMESTWFAWVLGLYLMAGACWIPVVAIQYRLRNLARKSENSKLFLDRSRALFRWWVVLGVVAFSAVIALFWLMIFRVTVF